MANIGNMGFGYPGSYKPSPPIDSTRPIKLHGQHKEERDKKSRGQADKGKKPKQDKGFYGHMTVQSHKRTPKIRGGQC